MKEWEESKIIEQVISGQHPFLRWETLVGAVVESQRTGRALSHGKESFKHKNDILFTFKKEHSDGCVARERVRRDSHQN